MPTPVVISPQVFPFRVLVAPPPLLAAGADVQVRVTLAAASVEPEVITEIDGFLDAFWMLASSGGLSGDLIRPEDSSITDKRDVVVHQNVMLWDLLVCRIDERALLNLLNLLYFEHGRHALASVEIAAASSAAVQPLGVKLGIEDYYPRMAPSPFLLNIDHPISESLLLSLRLEHPPSAAQVEAMEVELLSWSVAPAVGAFAVPDVGPEASGMVPEQSVEVFNSEIVWSVDRFRMHPAAIDSLVNCCAALSHRIATIKAVDVS